MSRVACFACVLIFLAPITGCVELGRRKVPLAPEIIGDGIRIRKPTVASSVPRPEGLEGMRTRDIEGFYRVSKTDTLLSIAERFYGDGSFIQELNQRNEDIFANAGGLKRGTVIVLPVVTRKPRPRPQPERQDQPPARETDAVNAASAIIQAAQPAPEASEAKAVTLPQGTGGADRMLPPPPGPIRSVPPGAVRLNPVSSKPGQ